MVFDRHHGGRARLRRDGIRFARPCVRVQVVPGQGYRSASLTKHIDVPPTGNFRISLDVRLDRPSGPYAEIDPLLLTFLPLGPGVRVQHFAIATFPNASRFEGFRALADGGAALSELPIILSYGRFQHYDIAVRSSGGNVTATLMVDGQGLTMRSLPASPVTSVTLSIGAPYTFDVDTMATLRFDNIRIEPL